MMPGDILMPTTRRNTADAIAADSQRLAAQIDALHLARDPGLSSRYSESVRAELATDVVYELRVLSDAMDAEAPIVFDDYIRWLSSVRAARCAGAVELHEQLVCVEDVLRTTFPVSATLLSEYLSSARGAVGQEYVEPGGVSKLGPAATRYLDLLLAGKRAHAVAFINDTIDQGTSVQDVYLGIIEPVQHEVGKLWQLDRWSIAQEHYCTAVSQLVLAQLYPRLMHASAGGPTLLATCVGGELHEMGARMVADFFEMDGWNTTYLGANTPTGALLKMLNSQLPNVLALSATNSFEVGALAKVIEAVRGQESLRDLKILVGGRPFQVASELWRRIGADAYAPDARTAVAAGRAMLCARGTDTQMPGAVTMRR
jgi:MerR family transcriptional regulator, light-induced transcriptional regulator